MADTQGYLHSVPTCVLLGAVEASQTIIKLAAGNGMGKVIVGVNGFMATPAMSALIRERSIYGERMHGACFGRHQSV